MSLKAKQELTSNPYANPAQVRGDSPPSHTRPQEPASPSVIKNGATDVLLSSRTNPRHPDPQMVKCRSCFSRILFSLRPGLATELDGGVWTYAKLS